MSHKLTVNLGLRYEFDVPRTEQFDRLSYFDLDASSPIASQVPANPFFNPAHLRGAMVFVDSENRRQTPTDRNNFGPHVGVACNVADKTVIRSAYGVYYMPSHMQAAGHSGSAGMMGFNSQTNMIVSVDSNRTPLRTIDNPFPDGFNLPPDRSLGASTFMGLNIGGGNGGRVHQQSVALRAAVERQRAARAARELHHRGGLHREQRERVAGWRERAAVLADRSVLAQPRDGVAGSSSESVLRYHQPTRPHR